MVLVHRKFIKYKATGGPDDSSAVSVGFLGESRGKGLIEGVLRKHQAQW